MHAGVCSLYVYTTFSKGQGGNQEQLVRENMLISDYCILHLLQCYVFNLFKRCHLRIYLLQIPPNWISNRLGALKKLGINSYWFELHRI